VSRRTPPNRDVRHNLSSHKPALPLYTMDDAERVLKQFRRTAFDEWVDILPGISVRWRPAGHILGAAVVEIDYAGRRIVFSGDLGRYDDAIMPDPTPVERADYLMLESTYGDRTPSDVDPLASHHTLINRTRLHGGKLILHVS